jgi:1-deoxy-D-xylulose-5-phosphate reductoisomerase
VAPAPSTARLGGTAPAVYNGANEACVAEFLAGRISFPRIVDTIARILSEHDTSRAGAATLEDVLDVDAWARARAKELNR